MSNTCTPGAEEMQRESAQEMCRDTQRGKTGRRQSSRGVRQRASHERGPQNGVRALKTNEGTWWPWWWPARRRGGDARHPAQRGAPAHRGEDGHHAGQCGDRGSARCDARCDARAPRLGGAGSNARRPSPLEGGGRTGARLRVDPSIVVIRCSRSSAPGWEGFGRAGRSSRSRTRSSNPPESRA